MAAYIGLTGVFILFMAVALPPVFTFVYGEKTSLLGWYVATIGFALALVAWSLFLLTRKRRRKE